MLLELTLRLLSSEVQVFISWHCVGITANHLLNFDSKLSD